MPNKVYSGAINACEAFLVDVEIDVSYGLPGFTIVGLPDAAVNEARERVRAAIKNNGIELPPRKIIINLAPADKKKEGSSLDLPLAISLLSALEKIPISFSNDFLFYGEMSLDGTLKHTKSVLPMAILAKEKKFKGIVIPFENYAEAISIPGISVHAFNNIKEIISAFNSNQGFPNYSEKFKITRKLTENSSSIDFSEIIGHLNAKRALEIAASGGHNLLMNGFPGTGKTMLAKAFPKILPDLDFDESIETTKIYSIKGLLPPESGLLSKPPFRSPHHTISDIALIGGGKHPSPGEVSLAHNGVLFLDEIPEFKRSVLEVLREPLTDGKVTISRAVQTLNFPARFSLIAAMNPCPCGFYGDSEKSCQCSAQNLKKYRQKISGPLLDRIDLQIHVPRIDYEEYFKKCSVETSEVILKRVIRARKRQKIRRMGEKNYLNAFIPSNAIHEKIKLNPESETLLLKANKAFFLSPRSHEKIIRIAQTIADLDDSSEIKTPHVAEAIQFRVNENFL
ncbi:MAG: YifB family Mg chelatase-like AAA ATPase [Candidatus Riflebacteria bacterium]|nr:YifB family Mg chelatase-like AAA ATPase [Candidatus Riflebacteria bacterium]